MNKRHAIITATAMLLTLFSAIGPASATDQSEAVKLCAKNPACGITRGNGGVNLQIEGGSGGGGYHAEIYCPDQGACVCVACPLVATNTGFLGTILDVKKSSAGSAPASLSDGGGASLPQDPGPGMPIPPDPIL